MNGATQTDTPTPRPKPLLVMAENIPVELKQLNQWVVWRYELNDDDEWTKVPYRVDRSGKASTTEPKDWTSFGQALATYQRTKGHYNGVGFVCTVESGIVGVPSISTAHGSHFLVVRS
jgi:putative DNA primase/helicase